MLCDVHIVHIVNIVHIYASCIALLKMKQLVRYSCVCCVQYAYSTYVHILCILCAVAFCIIRLKMKQLVRLQLSAAASQEMGEGNAALPTS